MWLSNVGGGGGGSGGTGGSRFWRGAVYIYTHALTRYHTDDKNQAEWTSSFDADDVGVGTGAAAAAAATVAVVASRVVLKSMMRLRSSGSDCYLILT